MKHLAIILFLVVFDVALAQYASDEEIVARTILKEDLDTPDTKGYEAVAWVIYNRMKNKGTNFEKTARSVCLQDNQFAVWSSYWGQSKAKIPTNTNSTSHKDYRLCLAFAKNLVAGKPPTSRDITDGAKFFLADSPSVRRIHPDGNRIGGNWFFENW